MIAPMLFAHTGPCRASEVVSTLGITGVVGLLLFRPWRAGVAARSRVTGIVVPLLIASVVTAGACSSKSNQSACQGPNVASTARLVIDAPAVNAVVRPDTTLKMTVVGGTVVKQQTGKITPDKGHIHVKVDGQLIVMSFQTTQDLHGLTPGRHAVEAEYVNICHQPFTTRVVASVLFSVQA